MNWTFLRQVKYLGLVALTTSAVTAFLSMYLLYQVSDSIKKESTLIELSNDYFYLLAVFFVVAILSRKVVARFTTNIIYKVRIQLLEQISNSEYSSVEATGKTRLFNMLSVDVNNISAALANLPQFIYNVILCISVLIYLAYLSLPLFLILTNILLLGVLSSKLFMWIAFTIGKKLRQEQDTAIESYQGLIFGNKELFVNQNRRSHFFNKRVKPTVGKIREHQRDNQFIWGAHSATSNLLIFLLLGLIVSNNHLVVDKTIVAQFIIAVIYFTGVFRELLATIEVYTQAKISIAKLKILNLKQRKANDVDDTNSSELLDWEKISLKNGRYSYNSQYDDSFSLGPISLELKKNETLFVVGGNGSGKSTFLKVFMGLLKLSEGSLKVDDKLIKENDFDNYQSKFLAIYSDFYLFSDLLGKNGEAISVEQAEDYLDYFQLRKKVDVVDQKFSTIDLSQGQRKRLALISALMEDKEILVLDEWAADQDPVFRQQFYQQLIPMLKKQGKTLLIVSHDDRYFSVADRIVKFENGIISDYENNFDSKTDLIENCQSVEDLIGVSKHKNVWAK